MKADVAEVVVEDARVETIRRVIEPGHDFNQAVSGRLAQTAGAAA